MHKIKGVYAYSIALFLNAFTDLGHKIIIQNTIFKIYDGSEQIMLTAIVNALILLPFILFFTPSGFLADRFAKHTIMKYAALFAVFITLGITASYYAGYFWLAFFFTFLLAFQSAIYSPAKYGYIKELVGQKYISSGNALIQSTTTIAILGGIMFYTIMFESSLHGDYTSKEQILQQIAPIGWLLVIGSLIEFYLSSTLPNRSTPNHEKFNRQRYISGYYFRKNLKTATRKEEIWLSIIALSLFWSISQVLLAVFGAYAKDTLHLINTIVVQGVMALAAVGIIAGSVIAAKMSRYYIQLGFAPLGALGMFITLILLPHIEHIYIVALLFLSFGIASGFMIVPLNAYIQIKAPSMHLGTILAANNFVQNIFMFGFLTLTTLFTYYAMSATTLIYLMAGVALVLFILLLRSHLLYFIWIIGDLALRLRYKIVVEGEGYVPKEGAVMLTGNHISWIDWLLVQLPLERRIRYIMERDIYNWKSVNWLFRLGDAIPISSKSSKDAIAAGNKALKEGSMLVIYPEGGISRSGKIEPFNRGFELVAKGVDGVIVPYKLDGLWGSRFSRSPKKWVEKKALFRRVIRITFTSPLPMSTTAQELQEHIEAIVPKGL